jgi:hypothetical protein
MLLMFGKMIIAIKTLLKWIINSKCINIPIELLNGH